MQRELTTSSPSSRSKTTNHQQHQQKQNQSTNEMGNLCVKTLVSRRRRPSPVSQHDWDGTGRFRRLESSGRQLPGFSRFSKWREGIRGTGIRPNTKLPDDVYLPAALHAALARVNSREGPCVELGRNILYAESNELQALKHSWGRPVLVPPPSERLLVSGNETSTEAEAVVAGPPTDNSCVGMTDTEIIRAIVLENKDRIMVRFNDDTFLKKWADAMVKDPDPEEIPFGAEADCMVPAPPADGGDAESVEQVGVGGGYDEAEFEAVQDEPVVCADGEGADEDEDEGDGGQVDCDWAGTCGCATLELAPIPPPEEFGDEGYDGDEEEKEEEESHEGMVLVAGAGPNEEAQWIKKTFKEMEKMTVVFYIDV